MTRPHTYAESLGARLMVADVRHHDGTARKHSDWPPPAN